MSKDKNLVAILLAILAAAALYASSTPVVEDIPGAKRPSYSIVYDAEDLTQF